MTSAPDVKTPVALIKVVGVVIGMIGLALCALAAFIVLRQVHMYGRLQTDALAFVAVLVPIIWFCLNAGVRFALFLPSPDNSVLSWSGWRYLAIYIAAVTTWLFILAIRSNLYLALLVVAVGGPAAKLSWDRSTTLKERGVSDAAL